MTDRERDDAHDPDDWFAEFERQALGDSPATTAPEPEPPAAAPLINPFTAPEPPPVDAAFDGGPQSAAEPPVEALPFETARLAEVAPDAGSAPTFWSQPGSAEPDVTQAMPPVTAEPAGWAPPPAAAVTPSPPTQPPILPTGDEPLPPVPGQTPYTAPSSPLDALFGDNAFREYQPGTDLAQVPFAGRTSRSSELVRVPGAEAGVPPPPRGPSRAQKVIFAIGGSILAVLLLIALFLLGTRLPEWFGPAPAVAPTPSASPSPTALPLGPVAPGEYYWDELLGGECLDPYYDAWQTFFTVVDCAEPHAGQMVFRGEFVSDGAEFPGAETLQAQITILCTAPGVVDLAAAGAYSDAQIQGSYPATREQWDEDPTYYCFVSRSSGEPLTGSVAIPQVAPEPEPAPTP